MMHVSENYSTCQAFRDNLLPELARNRGQIAHSLPFESVYDLCANKFIELLGQCLS